MNIDFSKCRHVVLADGSLSFVKEHAKIGVKAICEHPYFGLFDEMGAMKTAQSIIAAQFLFLNDVINRVLVIAPASVRPVWFDPELGELSKHLFVDINSIVVEFHSKVNNWRWNEFKNTDKHLQWMITNYEFIRSEERMDQLIPFCGPKTMLILDESSAVKAHNSQQSKTVLKIRKKCGRVVLLNGTPIANSPMDMLSQGNIMHHTILANKWQPDKAITMHQFRSRYAVMGGFLNKQVMSYQNLEDLQERFKPFVLRRLKKDCLDLPPALPPVTLTMALKPETWKIYKEMRDDMVAWLTSDTAATASQAAVRSMRLSQITSGFAGGIQNIPRSFGDDEDITDENPDNDTSEVATHEVGREKLDFLINWHGDLLEADENLKLLVFCRFIPELIRMVKEYQIQFPKHEIGICAGRGILGRKKEERDRALRLLNPSTAPKGPVTVFGTYGTGSLGLNFTACHTMMNVSSDYSPWKASQAAARIDRPGQVHSTSFFDLVATGPNGQKTIDHIIVKARREKEDINTWTSSAWVKALTQE